MQIGSHDPVADESGHGLLSRQRHARVAVQESAHPDQVLKEYRPVEVQLSSKCLEAVGGGIATQDRAGGVTGKGLGRREHHDRDQKQNHDSEQKPANDEAPEGAADTRGTSGRAPPAPRQPFLRRASC